MKKLLLLVLVLLAATTRSSAQAIPPFSSIGSHWSFSLTDEGRSVGDYIVDLRQLGASNAISGQVRTDNKPGRPLTGRYDRDTHAIAFAITVESPNGGSARPVLFVGVRNLNDFMSGEMVDADGHVWSWAGQRPSTRK